MMDPRKQAEAAQEIILKQLAAEDERDEKETIAAHAAALEAARALKEDKVFTGLTVSWVHNGEKKKVHIANDMSYEEFVAAVTKLPWAIRAKAPVATGGGRPLDILNDHRRRVTARQTKRYHAHEALAALRGN